jgi:hypothetical protein
MTSSTPSDATFEPTRPEEWFSPEPEEVTLPSGNRALCHKPNTFILGKTGQVPESVRKAAETKKKADSGEANDVSPENLAAVDILVDYLVCKAFLEPKVTLLRRKGCVAIDDLTADDKAFIIEHFHIEL